MNMVWLLIVGVVVFVLATFGAQNGRPVDLEYFGARLSSVPVWMVAIIPAAAGVLLGLLMALPGRVRGFFARRRDARTLQARDQTGGQQQQRIIELEGDLAEAQQPAQPLAQNPARDDRVAPSLADGPMAARQEGAQTERRAAEASARRRVRARGPSAVNDGALRGRTNGGVPLHHLPRAAPAGRPAPS